MPKDSKPPYFPFYVDDFAADGKVEAMTTEEVGAYILLLCKAWREDPVGSLPADDRVLARWARLSSDRWSECKLSVLSTFDLRTDGRLYQKRMEREFRKLKETKKKREKSASIAANTRWGDARRMRIASKSHSERNADLCHSSSSSSSESNSDLPSEDKYKGADRYEAISVPAIEAEFVIAWNAAQGAVPVRGDGLAPKRRVSFNARLKDPGWDWRAALAKFPLKLVESNPGGWKPDMDWFLRPDSVGRILEGKYDWAKATGTAGSAAGAAGRQSEIERRKELQRASLKGGSSNDGG